MIPAANVARALGKVGVDISKFLRDETGIYRVRSRVGEREFSKVVASLTHIQRENIGNAQVSSLVDGVIMNLTTINDLTDLELDILYSVVKDGGSVTVESSVSSGVQKALSRVNLKGKCKRCGFLIPKYAGRYPRSCPKCGTDLDIGELDYPLTFRHDFYDSYMGMVSDFIRKSADHGLNESIVCHSSVTLCEGVRDFFFALSDMNKIAVSKAMRRAYVDPEIGLPKLLLDDQEELKRGFLSLSEEHQSLVHPVLSMLVSLGEGVGSLAFFGVTRYLSEAKTVDERALSVVYASASPEVVKELRFEVGKRPKLTEAITSLTEDQNFFRLNKALSSCFTRTMIAGEHGNGEYRVIGEATLSMMDKAFKGDFDVPLKFLRTVFLG